MPESFRRGIASSHPQAAESSSGSREDKDINALPEKESKYRGVDNWEA